MKIGIFGGTFNPPHNTHVNIARQALKQLALDKLIIVPCGDPPHKYCDVDKNVRLELSRLAFGDFAEVSTYEIDKVGKSYTVETLRHFKQTYPDAEFYLVIGGDSFVNFDKWYCPDEIAQVATIAVADRANALSREIAYKFSKSLGVKAVFLDVEVNDVSSSQIRLNYQFGNDNSSFVPESVDAFIKSNGLYSKYRAMAQKLKGYLKPERYVHTFYVVKRGLEFATPDEYDKVFVACLLHDCAKYIGKERYAEYGYDKNPSTPEPVVHSYLGEKVAEMDFGVQEREILDAIRYHTTARPNMTRLDKIVYVADKTEETRPYPLEHLLDGTFDEIFIKCLVKANEYKDVHHGKVCDDPLTTQALEFYLNKK